MSASRIEPVTQLSGDQAAEVLELVEQVTSRDGVRPVSDRTLLQLRHAEHAADTYDLLRSGDRLVGFTSIDGTGSAEIAALDATDIETLVGVLAQHGNGTRVWAHGDRSIAAAAMRELGLRPQRVLLQMRRPLADELPEPHWPDGVAVRTFVVGQDEAAWLAVNNAAFADHPEQSGWTIADIESREQEKWFDPNGFFLAEADGNLVGFHWTKVHPARPTADRSAGAPIGEVYVVGVDPSMQGKHLGKALTLVGLHHLRDAGLGEVMLYADESNVGAVAMYERLGFTRYDADTVFAIR